MPRNSCESTNKKEKYEEMNSKYLNQKSLKRKE